MLLYDPTPIYTPEQQQQQQKQPRRSYGIMCADESGNVLMNESPPYFTQKSQYKSIGQFNLNSNIINNLLLASFPYGTSEGQFGLPKGRIDAIDYGSTINTKIREFIEETRHYHPILLHYSTRHYRDSNYVSPFTDNICQVAEEWVGLDNCLYWVEYTIIFIPSLSELIFLGNELQTREFLLRELPVIANADDKIKKDYKKKYHFGSQVDNLKTTREFTHRLALFHLDCNKLRKVKSINENNILQAYKKYELSYRIL